MTAVLLALQHTWATKWSGCQYCW